MSLLSRLLNMLRSDRVDQDLDDEQRFHIEARADELVAQGLSRRAALEHASRQFGNRVLLRERSRDVKLLPWLEALARDFRIGLRLLRKDAGVTAAVVISLGLAIGACTAAFSLIDALILRELPVREAQRLVYLSRPSKSQDPSFGTNFSYPFFDRIRHALAPQVEIFSMSAQSLRQAVLPEAGGEEEKLLTQFVSGNVFNVLGVSAAVGRLLLPRDDVTPGAHPVAVISHAFWMRRFGGARDVVGKWITLEQQPYQIVGVAPAGFTGAQPGILTDIWVPTMMFQAEARQSPLQSPNWSWLQIWGRLAPDVTRDAVQPVAATTLLNFEADLPHQGKGPQQRAEAAIEVNDAATGLSQIRREFARPLLVLAVIVGVVLIIACSNVANLLLARGAARTREMALRASIGAGRGRLLQQVLVESSVITIAAAGVGVLCAFAAIPAIVSMLTTNENPVYVDAHLDWRVLGFVAGLGCLTTVLFGLAPALRASAATPADAAALGDRRQTSRTGVVRSLVVVQVGFSVVVLFVAGLLLRSFDRLLAVDLGFTPDRVVLLSIEARERLDADDARAIGSQLLDRVRLLSGIESASMSSWALFRGWSWGTDVDVPARGLSSTFRLAVSPRFFSTMGTRLLDGREFVRSDSGASDPIPVIVNETFARKYLSGERAVGRRLPTTMHGRPVSYEIVGVAADARDGSVRGEMKPYLFSPIGDAAGTLEVRSSLDARTLADRVRQELRQVHPSLRLIDVTLQTSLVGNTLLRERLLAVLSGFFAALGLALAAVGLYGVLSYSVVRRTRELGIRLALGARRSALVRAVVGRIALAVATGVVAGIAGGLYFARFVRMLLFEIEPLSPSSVALPVICLFVVAIGAAWFPARHATRVDPAEALRIE